MAPLMKFTKMGSCTKKEGNDKLGPNYVQNMMVRTYN